MTFSGHFREGREGRIVFPSIGALPLRIICHYLQSMADIRSHRCSQAIAGQGSARPDSSVTLSVVAWAQFLQPLTAENQTTTLIDIITAAHYLELPGLLHAATIELAPLFASM